MKPSIQSGNAVHHFLRGHSILCECRSLLNQIVGCDSIDEGRKFEIIGGSDPVPVSRWAA